MSNCLNRSSLFSKKHVCLPHMFHLINKDHTSSQTQRFIQIFDIPGRAGIAGDITSSLKDGTSSSLVLIRLKILPGDLRSTVAPPSGRRSVGKKKGQGSARPPEWRLLNGARTRNRGRVLGIACVAR
ncbi:hypothetical protein ACFX13_042246 [Malus domestica]